MIPAHWVLMGLAVFFAGFGIAVDGITGDIRHTWIGLGAAFGFLGAAGFVLILRGPR